MFILLEMGYQSDKDALTPVDYTATKVQNVSFIFNKALGSGIAAIFLVPSSTLVMGSLLLTIQ